MKLTKFSDFSLRLLIYVAVKHPENSSIGEIGQSFDMSPAHLKKIVGELGRQGYLISMRGRGGGHQPPVRSALTPFSAGVAGRN